MVLQWRGIKDYITHQNDKGYYQKHMADSFSECIIVLDDFCTRMVDIKACGDPQMPFGPALLFLVFTHFLLQMIQEVSVGKAQLGG